MSGLMKRRIGYSYFSYTTEIDRRAILTAGNGLHDHVWDKSGT